MIDERLECLVFAFRFLGCAKLFNILAFKMAKLSSSFYLRIIE
jgi:hypothetical protein